MSEYPDARRLLSSLLPLRKAIHCAELNEPYRHRDDPSTKAASREGGVDAAPGHSVRHTLHIPFTAYTTCRLTDNCYWVAYIL